LDCDDEFYPDYLANIARVSNRGDVLLFQFDWEYRDPNGKTKVFIWDPSEFRDRLFNQNPAGILGVAHRRELIESLGVR